MASLENHSSSQPVTMDATTAPPLWLKVAHMVTHLCNLNKSREDTTESGIFHSKALPSITIVDYIKRIHKYAKCTEECFLMMLILLDRWSHTLTTPMTSRNVHRLILAAVVVAIKNRDDVYYCLSYYSSIGGVSMQEMGKLEIQFLKDVKWNLWISPHTYDKYLAACTKRTTAVVAKPSPHVLPPTTTTPTMISVPPTTKVVAPTTTTSTTSFLPTLKGGKGTGLFDSSSITIVDPVKDDGVPISC
eukprot:PhF_6_TR12862/c1_g1_i1/m.20205